MASLLSRIFFLALFLFLAGPAAASDGSGIRSIEAARSDWNAWTEPASGWVDVDLPDNWDSRWPGFNGVVWYRLTFDVGDPGVSTAIAVDYWTFAGALWLNGSLLERDESLVEPLTRSWNTSRFYRVPAPLLRQGENVLLVRVSGLAGYKSGLGKIVVGDAETLAAEAWTIRLLRIDMAVASLTTAVTLGIFFGVVWLLRRSETAYGWYAAMSLCWAVYVINALVRSPWPFSSTDGWARFNMVFFMLTCVAFLIFSIRFAGRRYARLERIVWATLLAGIAWMLLVPSAQIGLARVVLAVSAVSVYLAACVLFLGLTWRSRRVDNVAMNLVNVTVLGSAVYDISIFTGLLPGTLYTFPLTTLFRFVAMAFVLSWHFVESLNRIEHFQDELFESVRQARTQLGETLREQHELALAATRQNERLSLLHNLHDGLGGTLVNTISMIEQAPRRFGSERFLSVLKDMREELRGIIDMSDDDAESTRTLLEWILPLRSRYSGLCENLGIASVWRIDVPESCRPSSRVGLDLVRMVQESLTNVFKHADASQVDVDIFADDNAIRLAMRDNGKGFDVATTPSGTGLASLRARAERLGAVLDIVSTPGAGTLVSVEIPLADAPHDPFAPVG